MEKITKAIIEEINDITSYSDLIKLQKLIDVVINNDFRNSEKILVFLFLFVTTQALKK